MILGVNLQKDEIDFYKVIVSITEEDMEQNGVDEEDEETTM